MAQQPESPVSLVVGLGNPGRKYAGTRHNAGFWFADELARHYLASFSHERKFEGALAKIRCADRPILLLEPATYMNNSGRAVQAVANFFRIPVAEVLVAHDEIDLPPGTVRLKRGGGHGGHNGLKDTTKALGSNAFARLRLGVGHPGNRDDVIPYVLDTAGRSEQVAIERAVDDAAAQFEHLARGDWNHAFQALHTDK